MIVHLLGLLLAQQALFKPDPLTDYSGRSFGGVEFGVTTDADLKKRFQTGKGAIRPEGVVLSAGPDLKVDALLDGRGGQAKVIGLRLQYTSPQNEDRLFDALAPGKRFFAEQRYSDWSVMAFPKQGVAGLTVGGRVEVLIVTTPDRVANLVRSLEEDETRIDDLQREFERKDRTVRIRTVSLSLTSKNITLDSRNREEDELKRYLDRRYESRYLRYGSGNDGTLSGTVRIDFDRVEVSLSVTGWNEAGQISASGSGDARFRVNNDVAFYRRSSVEDAIRDALDRLEDAVIDRIQSQKPPSERDERLARFDELANRAIR